MKSVLNHFVIIQYRIRFGKHICNLKHRIVIWPVANEHQK